MKFRCFAFLIVLHCIILVPRCCCGIDFMDTLTPSQVQNMTVELWDYVLEIALSESTFTRGEVLTILTECEKLVSKKILAMSSDVARYIFGSISYVISYNRYDVYEPRRIKRVLELLAENTPLKDAGKSLSLESTGMSVYCKPISVKEKRELVAFKTRNGDRMSLSMNLKSNTSKALKHSTPTDTITVPMENIEESLTPIQSEKLKRVCVWSFKHGTALHNIKQGRQLGHQVVHLSYPGVSSLFSPVGLAQEVEILFNHEETDSHPRCVGLSPNSSFSSDNWKDNECTEARHTKTSTLCRCRHITAYALLALGVRNEFEYSILVTTIMVGFVSKILQS